MSGILNFDDWVSLSRYVIQWVFLSSVSLFYKGDQAGSVDNPIALDPLPFDGLTPQTERALSQLQQVQSDEEIARKLQVCVKNKMTIFSLSQALSGDITID